MFGALRNESRPSCTTGKRSTTDYSPSQHSRFEGRFSVTILRSTEQERGGQEDEHEQEEGEKHECQQSDVINSLSFSF